MKSVIFLLALIFYLTKANVDLQNLDVPNVDIDDFGAIREKCDKAGGPGTYDKLKTSKEALQTCVTQFANVSVVRDELEEAKKTGSMDEVFGKYCAKRPKLTLCVQTFTNNLRPCLNNDENKALNITLDILNQLGDFVCYKNGDRIAMFIAEGGVECIKSRTEGIKNCVNSTFKVTPASVNTNSLPNLLMDKKKCDDLGKLQSCVVEELEKCDDSTPANIIDALFRFVKRSACSSNKTKRSLHLHSILKRSTTFVNDFYDTTEMKTQMTNIFKEKCNKNAPDGGFEAATLTFESAFHCIKNKTKENPIFSVPAATFKENMQRCVKKLVEKTEACLPEDEKYWPKFYRDSLLNIVDVLYKYKNTMTGVSYRAELINCMQNFKQEPAKLGVMKCFDLPKSTDLHKEIVCGRLSSIKSCVLEQIRARCIRDITITQIFEDLFQAVTTPCKN